MNPTGPERIAVVGGTGFIGRHLVARLGERSAVARVMGLTGPGSSRNARWDRCDVRDPGTLRGAFDGIDVVFNLAAAHGIEDTTPQAFRAVNVDGARNVCEAASAAGVRRIIFTSSAAVYGHGRAPDEAAATHPRGHYGVTKLAAELVYRAWAAAADRRSVVIVRPTVVFGPGGGGTGGRLIRHLAGPHFAHVGAAKNRKSLAFVENLAEFLAFIRDTPGRLPIFNYADTPDLPVSEIATIVRSAVGLAPAPRRSVARAWASSAPAVLAARLAGRPDAPVLTSRATIRRLARDMRFDATEAHRSGFRQPFELSEALAMTARADIRWVALLTQALTCTG